MEPIEIHSVATPDLQAPALIEGLPGTGLVGTLGANHLVGELDGQPVRQIYSEHFHPIVTVDNEGTATLDPLTVYAIETEGRDLLVLAGRIQAEDSAGQYRLTDALLDIALDFGVTEVYTMGGAVMGEPIDDHTVVGAVAEGSSQLKERLKAAGVSFHGEVPMTIGGISGLLLGLAPQRELAAASLLGTTRGFQIDPKSAQVVLDVLQETLGFSIDLTPFNERPEEKKKSVRKTQKILQMNVQEEQGSGDSLRYFG